MLTCPSTVICINLYAFHLLLERSKGTHTGALGREISLSFCELLIASKRALLLFCINIIPSLYPDFRGLIILPTVFLS